MLSADIIPDHGLLARQFYCCTCSDLYHEGRCSLVVQSVFGMNVVEINPGSLETIARYVETTIALTLFTTWIVIALQPYSSIHEHSGGGVWRRMAWPFYFSNTLTEYLRQVKPPSSQKDNTPSSQKDNTSSQKDITPSSQKDNTSMRFLPRRGPSFLNKREGSLA
jgi:hypothetical protein